MSEYRTDIAVGPIDPTFQTQDNRRWTKGQTIKLSILMPAYNEQRTIHRAVQTVLATPFPCEIELIIVDDGSRDSTAAILAGIDDERVVFHRHPVNRGKGAAIRTASRLATGTHIVPFDADLEYAPGDLCQLLVPILEGRCDVVFGTRLFGMNTVYQSYRYAVGGRLLTQFANVLFDAYLSDLHTCLKLIPLQLFRDLRLRESGFGLDTELAARVLSLGVRPFEIPVSYHSRSHAEGKKIGWRDGVECLAVLTKVRVTGPTHVRPVVDVSERIVVSLPRQIDLAGASKSGRG